MTTPLKYEDLALKVAELERTEAALREELYQAKKARDAEMLNGVRTQQRLTVAEKLLREVLESGDWFRSALEFINGEGLEVREKIEASLKPAADGEEK